MRSDANRELYIQFLILIKLTLGKVLDKMLFQSKLGLLKIQYT